MPQILIGYLLLPVLFLLGAKNLLSFVVAEDPTHPRHFSSLMKGLFFFVLFLVAGHIYFLFLISHAGV